VPADLLIVVPTRGRPDNIRRLVAAWDTTGAAPCADLMIAFDADDPARDDYADIVARTGIRAYENLRQTPMVPALEAATASAIDAYPAVGCMGDDHVPRTPGWAATYLSALRELGTGIVYGDDRHRGEDLPTQWAMTSNIVNTLGRMVPAPVQHLYSDRSVLDLGRAADCIRYLPDVVVEHMHYAVGKAVKDDGYHRVNAGARYRADHAVYRRWLAHDLRRDVRAIRRCRRRPW
jgi:hypothetical protein